MELAIESKKGNVNLAFFFKATREALHRDFQGRAARSDFALPVVVYVMAILFPSLRP